ncbi:hypothetical protein B0H16DRAFT_1561423 [Mycena metata]|uniref:Uncharacterized protein n=1 Tax=Mycena metata TaxID=1033252 RepID=A0AAD7N301_9AGAR|nr:hypothetical protein B0H16DRAFT_1561423 [Mycena metata]
MSPWDFLKRQQAEVRAADGHNVLHRLVRFVGTAPSEAKDGVVVNKDPSILLIHWERMQQGMEALVVERLDHDKRMGEVESRLEQIESRLEGVDSRLEAVDSRLEAVDSRLERILNILTASQTN